MKKLLLLLVAVVGFNVNSWSQPDYSIITFKSTLYEYKKNKPNIKNINLNKEDVKKVVYLLGNSFYNDEKIDDITNRIWLSFIDPEKFDFVFKDLAIRTLPNWNKKDVRGKIVLEPNPFLAEWTQSDGELQYIQKAFSLILAQYNLMAYSEDAISTKKSLRKLLYTNKMNFRPARSGDWTNSYLKYANNIIKNKGLTSLIANGNYNFLICKASDKDEIVTILKKISWNFISP